MTQGTPVKPAQSDLFFDKKNTACAWIDGASSGNPGPAGAGVVLTKDGNLLGEWKEKLGETTNNVAEYRGLLLALEKSSGLGIRSLIVYTDSELLYRQMTGIYKVRTPHIKELYLKVQILKKRFEFFMIKHVPREENKEADRLARRASLGK